MPGKVVTWTAEATGLLADSAAAATERKRWFSCYLSSRSRLRHSLSSHMVSKHPSVSPPQSTPSLPRASVRRAPPPCTAPGQCVQSCRVPPYSCIHDDRRRRRGRGRAHRHAPAELAPLPRGSTVAPVRPCQHVPTRAVHAQRAPPCSLQSGRARPAAPNSSQRRHHRWRGTSHRRYRGDCGWRDFGRAQLTPPARVA